MDINNDGSISNDFQNVEGFGEEEIRKFVPLIQKTVTSYTNKSDDVTDENWLNKTLSENLPNKSAEEISSMSQDILTNISHFDKTWQEAHQARVDGLKPHEWVANKIQEAAAGMNAQKYGERIGNLYAAYKQGNEEMMKTILTKNGTINMNPNLDGFIAEQKLVNSFNINAAKSNSIYEARVLRPEGNTYGKNSVDIGIYDKTTNKLVRRYQAKFYSTPETTTNACKSNNYTGQRFVVSEGQSESVKKNFSDGRSIDEYIESPDGVRSDSFRKEDVKNLQEEIQTTGNIPQENLALELGKQVAFAGAAGAAMGAGVHVMSKILSDEKIEADEVICAALKSGADSGIKAAVGGVLEIAANKGILPSVIGKGISKFAGPIVEGLKIFGDFITGEIDGEEAVERFMWLGATTFVTDMVLGSVSIASIGSAVMAALPVLCSPVGLAVGAAAGLTLGAMAFGSEICDAIGSACETIGGIVSDIGSGIGSVVEGIGSAIGSFVDWLFG